MHIKMAAKSYILVSLLSCYLYFCASSAVHSHNHEDNTLERESDGSYRPRDADHYRGGQHNTEFDHEAILGSVKEAEEFDNLSPEESKRRLALLLPKMDTNSDGFIDSLELKNWIYRSFGKLSREEAEARLSEADDNNDGKVSWTEYLKDAFGTDLEEEIGPEDTGDAGMLVYEEKEMWRAADTNGDGVLDIDEFEVFANPEEHEAMHPYIIKQFLREKDKNNDGLIDFEEFLSDRSESSAQGLDDREWVTAEKEKFVHEFDLDKSGTLDIEEVKAWIIPDNQVLAEEETEHLMSSADDNQDNVLSYDEILSHHDVFVGSEAGYGSDMFGDRFDDEL